MNQQVKSRAAFEAWASSDDAQMFIDRSRHDNNLYAHAETNDAWGAWQAAIAHDRKQRGEPVGMMREPDQPGEEPWPEVWADLPVGTPLYADPVSGQSSVPGGYSLVPTEILDRFPEMNLSNYGHDDACAMNAWGVEVVLAAAPKQPTQK